MDPDITYEESCYNL